MRELWCHGNSRVCKVFAYPYTHVHGGKGEEVASENCCLGKVCIKHFSLISWFWRSGGSECYRWLGPAMRVVFFSKEKQAEEDGLWAGQWVCILFHLLTNVWKATWSSGFISLSTLSVSLLHRATSLISLHCKGKQVEFETASFNHINSHIFKFISLLCLTASNMMSLACKYAFTWNEDRCRSCQIWKHLERKWLNAALSMQWPLIVSSLSRALLFILYKNIFLDPNKHEVLHLSCD